jgi:hypothetical protein
MTEPFSYAFCLLNSLGPRELAEEGKGFAKQRIEACVMGGDEQRMRVVYVVQRRDADSAWKVYSYVIKRKGQSLWR